MNIRGILAIIRCTWMSWLQQRSFFFLLAFGWMMPPLVALFVWYTAASGQRIGGLTQSEFVAYYLLFMLVNQLTYAQTNWTVGDRIRNGDMSTILLRPISPILDSLASELASKAAYMLFVVPVVIVLALVLHPELHPPLLNVLAFVPALLMAWLLRFFWGYWLALLAFWASRANALLSLQEALTFLLAGQVAPVALLPSFVRALAIVLPFRYMVGFPVEILTTQLSPADLVSGLAYQTAWLLATVILFSFIWRCGVRRYTAVGG
ncbi:hypothetical protein EPA93_40590 [Ktedonosporobacter rubrisoli]|uniref:ABC transporter permease n=1 Tax=Ktedonosporobacter rubrisoli TaxID=2509675 RepID=A0A4P6K279_KTERU|nr:ABC-2 family transporter protein [Ktedonosporobacter rubrisoli]QBD81943.1 hypothetical protein EPA93_40590 [Ktedonosporobacter rubrisoli]